MKKIVPLLIASALFVTGCSTAKTNTTTPSEEVIKYNGGQITKNDVVSDLGDVTINRTATDLLMKNLLFKKYENQISQAFVDKTFSDMALQYGGEETFKGALAQQGMTPEKYKEALKMRQAQALMILEQAGMGEDKIKEYYETAKTQHNLAHILISIKSDLFPNGLSEEDAKKKIDEIKAKLDKGEDFAKLAKENSMDSVNAEKGGELGWLSKQETNYGDDFVNNAFKAEKGKYTEPFKTTFGYHIAKTLDTKDLTYEEMKPKIVEIMATEVSTKTPEVLPNAVKKLFEENGVQGQSDSIKKYIDDMTKLQQQAQPAQVN